MDITQRFGRCIPGSSPGGGIIMEYQESHSFETHKEEPIAEPSSPFKKNAEDILRAANKIIVELNGRLGFQGKPDENPFLEEKIASLALSTEATTLNDLLDDTNDPMIMNYIEEFIVQGEKMREDHRKVLLKALVEYLGEEKKHTLH